MKFLSKSKDGGPQSTVWAYWLFEIKWLCSIVLLRFEDGSRDAYHSHAFNSFSWLLSGELEEIHLLPCIKAGRCKKQTEACNSPVVVNYFPSIWPIVTRRTTTHKVVSVGTSWVLSFRGPWADTWLEQTPDGKHLLTHGRKEIKPVDWGPNMPVLSPDALKEKIRQFGASREE
jgi:hypothetical protein